MIKKSCCEIQDQKYKDPITGFYHSKECFERERDSMVKR